MKAGDFFISLRQLFGVIIPGAIWACVFCLIVLNENPLTYNRNPNGFEVAIVIFGFYLIGYSARHLAFTVGGMSGDLCNWIEGLVPEWMRKWAMRSRSLNADERIIRRARVILDNLKSENITYDPADVPVLCKFYVLGESELSRKVEELEAEINLFATMVLPLMMLVVALIMFWNREPRTFELASYQGAVLGALLFTIVTFAHRAGSRRSKEAHEIFLMFMVLAELKQKNSQPVISTDAPKAARR